MYCLGCNTKLIVIRREQPGYGSECYDDIIEYRCPECGTVYTVHVKRGDINKWR
jgi:uncharacterized Zn finger protein